MPPGRRSRLGRPHDMKIFRSRIQAEFRGRGRPRARCRGQRGAALLLSLLILLVLVAIVIQINVSTGTDARVARNDVGLTGMDLATESALLQVYDKLKADAENTASGDAASPAAGGTSTSGADPQAQ